MIYEDHPRTRGEKYVSLVPILVEPGSPPHTRGKVLTPFKLSKPTRITPAHAGKSILVHFVL